MDISHLIQSALAPVFLLSGVATTLGVLTGRLMRLFANAFFGYGYAGLIALLFVGAMMFITAAYIAFLIEVRIAIAHLQIGSPQSLRDDFE